MTESSCRTILYDTLIFKKWKTASTFNEYSSIKKKQILCLKSDECEILNLQSTLKANSKLL